MVVANAVAGFAEISQTCGKDLLDLDRGNIPKLLAGSLRDRVIRAGEPWFKHGLLVGGLEHDVYSIQLGMLYSQLTFIFFRGVETTKLFCIEKTHGFLFGKWSNDL